MKRSVVVLIIAVLLAAETVNFVFSPLEDEMKRYPSGLGDYPDRGAFQMDPATILLDLRNGNRNVFTPDGNPLKVHTSTFGNAAIPPWHEEDYFRIAEVLDHSVWNDDLRPWQLWGLGFGTSCAQSAAGFGFGNFVYFRPAWINGRLHYTTRELDIYPLDKQVAWGGGTMFPHPILGWKAVDRSSLRATAEQALELAEDHGGRAVRRSVGDRCNISLGLSAEDGWSVWYTNASGLTIFAVRITTDRRGNQVSVLR